MCIHAVAACQSHIHAVAVRREYVHAVHVRLTNIQPVPFTTFHLEPLGKVDMDKELGLPALYTPTPYSPACDTHIRRCPPRSHTRR